MKIAYLSKWAAHQIGVAGTDRPETLIGGIRFAPKGTHFIVFEPIPGIPNTAPWLGRYVADTETFHTVLNTDTGQTSRVNEVEFLDRCDDMRKGRIQREQGSEIAMRFFEKVMRDDTKTDTEKAIAVARMYEVLKKDAPKPQGQGVVGVRDSRDIRGPELKTDDNYGDVAKMLAGAGAPARPDTVAKLTDILTQVR